MAFERVDKDGNIVERVLGGNVDAFGTLVDRYLPVIHGMACAQVGNVADAEDVAQDVFLNAFQSLNKLRDNSRFGPWLMRITRNKCNDLLRARFRERGARAQAQRHLGDGTVDPEVEGREMHGILRTTLAGLDGKAREVLVLHYFAGRTTAEIAALLEISRHAAKKRLERARAQLSERLLGEIRPALKAPRPKEERRAQVMAAIAGGPIPWALGAVAPGVVAAGDGAAVTGGILSMKVIGTVVLLAAVAVAGLWGSAGYRQEPEDSTDDTAIAQTKDDTRQTESLTASSFRGEETPRASQGPASESGTTGDTVASEEVVVAAGVIAGRLHDVQTNRGIGEIRVSAHASDSSSPGEGPAGSAVSDANGHYRIEGLASGTYAVTCPREVAGYLRAAPAACEVIVQGDVACEGVDFAFREGLALSGHVVDEQGRRVADAAVYGKDRRGGGHAYRVQSDSRGAFVFEQVWPAETLALQASTHGRRTLEHVSVAVLDHDVADVVLTLYRTGTLDCAVVDPVGRPVPGASVSARSAHFWGNMRTDERGHLVWSSLPPGEYALSVQGPWQADFGEDLVRVLLVPGGEATGVTLRLDEQPQATQQMLSISGRVTDRAGNPIVRADVTAREKRESRRRPVSVSTDEDGNYEIGRLLPGAHSLTVYHGTHDAVSIEGVEAGSAGVDVVMRPRCEIAGRVVCAETGESVSDFVVWPTGPVRTGKETRFHHPEGRFRVMNVDSGTKRVKVRADGFSTDSLRNRYPSACGRARARLPKSS